MRRSSPATERWPLSTSDGTTRQGHPHLRVLSVASGMVLLGIALATPGLPLAARIAVGAVAVGLLATATLRRRRPEPTSGATIVADAAGLSRTSPEGAKRLVEWRSPFGVVLLASYGRPNALLAFTTPAQTRYIPARIDGRSDAADAVLARVALLADLDLVDGVSHDAALSADDAASLVRHAEDHDRRALGRVFLSDGRGAPIALEREALSVAGRRFDLERSLEWRPLMFHESTGQGAALYQATWIRQDGAEVVLVAPMPASMVPRESGAHREAAGELGRALTGDLRLLQSPSETPPARELRVAIERPFMLAVRRMLDEAPLAARMIAVPAKEAAHGRDSLA